MNILTSRQEKILELIVLEYVKTVNPVGSKHICDELNCSSATVRSEMSTLEDYGYLEKTHISSGRVPSEKGYRYYVDNLMKQEELNGNDMMNLQIIFNNNKLALTDCIKKSLEIITDITDYTTVVLGNKSSDNYLKKVEALPIEDNKMLAIVITDKGFVEHKKVDINNISLDEIQKTVELINKLLIGTPIDEVRKKLELEIKPIINKYVKQHEAIYNAFYDVFNDFTSKNVSFVGKNNMLKQPEFNNVDKIKKIFDKFESPEVIDFIEEDKNDVNVYIGKETKLDDDVTIIKTKYKLDGEEGTIAIIGPKRMEYNRVVNMLEFVKENLEER